MQLKYIFNTVLLVAIALPGAVCAQQPGAEQAPAASSATVPTAGAIDPPPADNNPETMLPHFKSTRFWLYGQANFIFQTHPDFPALYSGPHSLNSHYEKATSRVVTLTPASVSTTRPSFWPTSKKPAVRP